MSRPAPSKPRTVASSATTSVADAESTLRFGPLNGALVGIGLASIVYGFVLLAGGSTVGAPLLLVLGFAVLVPLGIIL
ncbi:MAG TPA: hypothetical protein VGB24_24555 [Longimicrobium sp.]|jgi:hypothetical protein|uniref:hypothetical protein n=1 Tax=Longimicrobium sp. TaxID=2029185 RepID=UPI002ED98705